ncbi:DUF456 domain-containing protein [Halobacteriales archaeon QH_3_68_24]|nr:MAG: DUF456 domain-containing protein [Halobacteriales archaeon QH_3_68_24]
MSALPALTTLAASPALAGATVLQQLPALPEVGLSAVLVVLAFVLLGGGVVGSVAPVIPSGLLSLAGVLIYWVASGFGDPDLLVLSGLVLVSVVAMAAEWLSGAVSAKAGGASTKTTVAATLVGFLGLLVVGPVGFILGTALTVFGLTYWENEDAEASARAAGVTILGMLTSSLAQLLLTVGVLVVMVFVLVF